MGKNTNSDSLKVPDYLSHSTANIFRNSNTQFQCGICKETDISDDLVELCKCQDLVHQSCMIQKINKWIQNQEDQQSQSQDTKQFICDLCNAKVYFKSQDCLICNNFQQIFVSIEKSPFKSIFSFVFFLIGLGLLIISSLVKSGKICVETSINRLTISALVVAALILSSLIVLISSYFIFIDILTDKKKTVEKVYIRNKKSQKKPSEQILSIEVS